MKIDTKEIEKINDALNNIDGWHLEDFKVWQTQSGKDMATIRLSKSEKKDDDTEGLDEVPFTPVGMGGMAATINISSDDNDN